MIQPAMIEDRNILDAFTQEFASIVEKYCEYIIVSGFVAISSGRSRATEDIDIIIERVDETTFKMLHAQLCSHNFECIQNVDAKQLYAQYLDANLSIRYIKKGQMLPNMELKLAKDALDSYQLRTKIKLPQTGLDIWFSNINVNIAFKEHLLKSPKDLEDAQHLRIVYEELIDTTEIKHVMELIDTCRLL